MEVINENNFETKASEQLPQILNRIFSICKNDPSFQLKEELQISEETMEKLQVKIDRKKNLISKSKDILENLQKRNKKLENDNNDLKAKLLEALGSEL